MHEQCTKEEEAPRTDLDTPNPELHQRSEHLPSGDFIGRPANGNLDEKTVIVRLEPSMSITGAVNFH